MPPKSAHVKNEKQYEALKEKGMSKSRAARIANSPKASSNGGKKSGSGGNAIRAAPLRSTRLPAARVARRPPRSTDAGGRAGVEAPLHRPFESSGTDGLIAARPGPVLSYPTDSESSG